MKRAFLIFMIPLLLFGCKVKERKTATKIAESPGTEALRHADRPVVSTVDGKYNFVDSTVARAFIRLHITSKGELMSLKELNDNFQVQWIIQSDAGIREKLGSGRLAFTAEMASVDDEYQYLVFDFPRIRDFDSAILLLEMIHPTSGTKYNFDMGVDFTASRSNSRYEIYNKANDAMPRFGSFLKAGEPFVIKSLEPSSEPIFLVYYENNSLPAPSPMSGKKREAASEFSFVKIEEIKDRQQIVLNQPGMYLLTQNRDDYTDGYGFYVGDDRFPRITNPDALREAMVYMSTAKEIDSIKAFPDAKDGLDMHFLTLGDGDQALAKRIIRSYYQRIEEANKIFTNYKEGWKTDRGMVYTIMGPPAKIQRNRNREVWVYSKSKNTSEIIFTFYKRPNLFTDQNYELVRYPEYSAFWYPYVEAWRTGKVGE